MSYWLDMKEHSDIPPGYEADVAMLRAILAPSKRFPRHLDAHIPAVGYYRTNLSGRDIYCELRPREWSDKQWKANTWIPTE